MGRVCGGDALTYSGSGEGRGVQYCVGIHRLEGEIPAAPHTVGSGPLCRNVCSEVEAGHRLP